MPLCPHHTNKDLAWLILVSYVIETEGLGTEKKEEREREKEID